MKFLGTILVLFLAPVACIGEIPSGTAGNNTGTEPSNRPPVNPPPVAVGSCSEATLARPRVWRLTNLQMKNTLRDALGTTTQGIDRLPALEPARGVRQPCGQPADSTACWPTSTSRSARSWPTTWSSARPSSSSAPRGWPAWAPAPASRTSSAPSASRCGAAR